MCFFSSLGLQSACATFEVWLQELGKVLLVPTWKSGLFLYKYAEISEVPSYQEPLGLKQVMWRDECSFLCLWGGKLIFQTSDLHIQLFVHIWKCDYLGIFIFYLQLIECRECCLIYKSGTASDTAAATVSLCLGSMRNVFFCDFQWS